MSNPQPLITPKEMQIAITGRCNLRCKYCFYADEMVALHDLPTAAWLHFFEELGSLGLMRVTLTGGEVFTRPDLFELIDGVIANRIRYSILSNGTLITEEVLKQFEVGKRRLRLDNIQISIDGSTSEIHNLSRPKSFDRAIRGLKLLREAGFPTVVRVTINRHNVYDLENIAHLLLDELGLPTFGTNDAMPIGAGCANQPEIALTIQEQVAAMEAFDRLAQRYPGRINSQAGPQAKRKMYEEMEHAKATGEKTPRWLMGCLSGCNRIFSGIDVLHDGTLVPCHMLPGIKLGNLTTDSLEEIWLNHPMMKALRERRNIPMASVPGCEACEWSSYCNGGCPGLAHQMTGNFNLPSPQDCYRRFLAEAGEQYVRRS
jgi:SynChlorMet cassette radical SAM/SPASM protein ScmE